MANKQSISTINLRKLAQFGYVGLLIFMPLWLFLLKPSEALSPALTFVMFILPLLFPLRGIIKGDPYTFAWANFVILIYFMHSLTTLWVATDEIVYALIELFFVTIMFFAGSYYSKYRGQELGLKIPKLKTDLEQERQAHQNNDEK